MFELEETIENLIDKKEDATPIEIILIDKEIETAQEELNLLTV